ncbi:MAG TPA: PilZ domain-containing protein [bacterium]|nr:PilZ domain-containing protein [bacterium]
MINITIETTKRAIREKYFPIGPASDIFFDLTLLPEYESIKVGGAIEIKFVVTDEGKELIIHGNVSWKRPREIKLPGRVMPAGIGVKLDEKSYDLIEDRILKEESELSDLSMMMVGGNYIRVRHDIAQVLRNRTDTKDGAKKTKEKKGEEKRVQPRLGISVPVEVFINDQVANFKTRDISLSGMSFETTEPLKEGEEIVIILEDRTIRKQFILKAKVIRHIPHPDDSRRMIGVGVVFLFDSDTQQKDLMNFIVRHS